MLLFLLLLLAVIAFGFGFALKWLFIAAIILLVLAAFEGFSGRGGGY